MAPCPLEHSIFWSADKCAKVAAISDLIPEAIDFTLHEASPAVEDWIWDQWQKEWASESTCKYQSVYQLERKYLKTLSSRRNDIIKNRLRLLQSKLNGGLYKIGQHEDGLCTTCGVIQDNHHFVMECSDTYDLREHIKTRLKAGDYKWNYQELTSNHKTIEMITKHILLKNIEF